MRWLNTVSLEKLYLVTVYVNIFIMGDMIELKVIDFPKMRP